MFSRSKTFESISKCVTQPATAVCFELHSNMSRKRKSSSNKGEETSERGKRLRLQPVDNQVLETDNASDLTQNEPHLIELLKYEETDESGEDSGKEGLQYYDGNSSESGENDAGKISVNVQFQPTTCAGLFLRCLLHYLVRN